MNSPSPSSLDTVKIILMKVNHDHRGWLTEIFRNDELPEAFKDVATMGYVSLTHPHVIRGPHQHQNQTDYFIFISGIWNLKLWDADTKQSIIIPILQPTAVIVPPPIIHAYANVGSTDGLTINLPNRLYKGPGKAFPIDEIRHEDNPAFDTSDMLTF
jgi:dTDP-4-dehydrorhamnose 3,5-epimerase